MKSNLEKQFAAKRESAEALMKDECPDAIEMMCSFSDLDCVVDVKLEEGWRRYVLIEGDDESDTLRRIG